MIVRSFTRILNFDLLVRILPDAEQIEAVALLPPLVTFGRLLGGGHMASATGALSLLLMSLIRVNLAGVTTFLAQGIRPATWWEKDRAVKATRIALVLWAVLLTALVGLILLLRKA